MPVLSMTSNHHLSDAYLWYFCWSVAQTSAIAVISLYMLFLFGANLDDLEKMLG